jgi:hypothetical protein
LAILCFYSGSGESAGDGNGDGDKKYPAPPSWDLAATTLVIAAEAVAKDIADNADGDDSGVAIVSSTSLAAGGRVIN